MPAGTLQPDQADPATAGGAKASKHQPVRYRLNAVAADIRDVVQNAGGWLYDRAMAGWDVGVALIETGDDLALRILGVRASEFDAAVFDDEVAGLAVGADALVRDHRVQDGVLAALGTGSSEVALWGDSRKVEVGEPVDFVRYRLSAAARVFKAHALAAAGCLDVSVAATETLLRSGYRPLGSDLIPVG